MAHTHPCPDCRTPVECPGEFERNDDGYPEVICDVYHVRGVQMPCEDCGKLRQIDSEQGD